MAGVESGLVLEELREAGATFAYPEALTAFEWVTLTAVSNGRSRAVREKAKRDAPKK